MVKMCDQALPVKLSTFNTNLLTSLGRLSLKKGILRKVYINYVLECEMKDTEAGWDQRLYFPRTFVQETEFHFSC